MNSKKIKNLLILILFTVVFISFSHWIYQQGPEIFTGYLIIVMIIMNLTIWFLFKKSGTCQRTFSGTFTEGLPEGFVIKYGNANQKPLVSKETFEHDFLYNVDFGNCRLVINGKNRKVAWGKKRGLQFTITDHKPKQGRYPNQIGTGTQKGLH